VSSGATMTFDTSNKQSDGGNSKTETKKQRNGFLYADSNFCQ